MKYSRFTIIALGLLLTACTKQTIAPENTADRNTVAAAKTGGSTGVVSYLTGSALDVQTATQPGLVLMGGSTDVDNAIKWLLDRSGGGDVVVIRSTGADGYNTYMFGLSNVNSVESIIIDSRTKAADASVIAKIKNAEALFIAGGDQWDYVNFWKNTPVEDAINYLLNTKKVPVGGTSAGLAILGTTYYSAQNGTITSDQALANPYNKSLTLGTNDFLNVPFMVNTVTDSHYSQRTRQGRHITFLARMMQDWGYTDVKGIGIDEETAVCVDENGIGKVYGINKAYFIRNTALGAETCVAKKSLTWNRNQTAVSSYAITGSATGNGSFNLSTWTGATGGTSSYFYVANGLLF